MVGTSWKVEILFWQPLALQGEVLKQQSFRIVRFSHKSGSSYQNLIKSIFLCKYLSRRSASPLAVTSKWQSCPYFIYVLKIPVLKYGFWDFTPQWFDEIDMLLWFLCAFEVLQKLPWQRLRAPPRMLFTSNALSLFSCPQQLNRWPCHSLTHWLTQDFTTWHSKSDPGGLWPLRHLIRVMKKHDLTNIFTFVDNFDNFTMLTIFDSLIFFYNFWQCFDNSWQFCQFLRNFTILTMFDIVDNFWQFLTIWQIDYLWPLGDH